ncbi:MarR family winged helix-turn-helix transcriptional regulator [Streptacidiphilus fuscans]|uniref:MarR family transcriptional regulator n=1 Tax=Streptacidiphilus fuscans TaxID=2789292 RepID=A0A931B3E3_9ACTN|nr:MarR family transcriptional regulator [Streptacidiphilus fuscans]MBF9069521.1 MarR family transcriptional regulator [Streptacidiphilus fuscans]
MGYPRSRAASTGEGTGDAVDGVVADWRRERPELDTEPLQVMARLHRTFARYQSLLTDSLEEYGLNIAGFDVLTALRRAGPPYRLTAGQLAASGLITTAGMTLRADRLEKDGLIVRERDENDRRIVHSRLTEQGLTLIDEVFARHLDNERRMLAGLSGDERRLLAALLARLETSLDAAADQAAEPQD